MRRSTVKAEREFCFDNLLARIHVIVVMMRWPGLAPWEFEFPFRGSLASTFLEAVKANSNHFGGQGKQGAEEVERLTASLADEQAPILPRDPKPEPSPETHLPASRLV